MDPSLIVSLVLVAVLVAALVWLLANYNRFVRLRNHVRESWSDVDVELKRRYELIPNLVATVKGYASHERAVLERLTELRTRAMGRHRDAREHGADETEMLRALKAVFAVGERYPDLKSDRAYRELQEELALTEDRIAAARRFFNGNVRELRNLCQTFPSNLLAQTFGFAVPTFFELDDEVERVVPQVSVAE